MAFWRFTSHLHQAALVNLKCISILSCTKLFRTSKIVRTLSSSRLQHNISNIENICQQVDQALKRDMNLNIEGTLSLLKTKDPNWMFQLPGQKLLGSILNGLSTAEKYRELDLLVKDLLASEYEMKLGMRTTVLQAMMARGRWTEAVQFLEDTKKLYTLKHARMYPPLIKGLANAGQLPLAYHYFLEMQELAMTLQTTKSTPDRYHLIALVNAACEFKIEQMNNDEKKTTIFDIILNDGETNPAVFDPKPVIKGVLQYIETWNFAIGNELADALISWFELQPDRIEIHHLSPDSIASNVCPHCGFTHSKNTTSEDFADVIYTVRDDCRKYYLKAKYKLEMNQLNSQLTDFDGEVDVIIDGANVGYSQKYADETRRTFNFDLLNDLVEFFKDQPDKNVLVILLQSVLRKYGIKQTSAVDKLRHREEWETWDHIQYLPMRHFSDDTAMIYAAAVTEYNNPDKKVEIITNDSLNNQRFMFKNDQLRAQLLRWLHSRQTRWYKDKNGDMILTKNIDKIMKTKGKDFHIHFENGGGICVIHKELK